MNADIADRNLRPRPRRLGLYLPFALLLLVAVGWSALWFYGRSRIDSELDAFFARQSSLGREWSCPDRRLTGFPFRIEGRCTNPSYTQRGPAGEAASGSLKGLVVVATTAGALNLAHVVTELEGPLTVKAPGLPDTVATWRSARSSLRGGLDRLERVSVEVEAPSVAIAGEAAPRWSAQRLTAHLREGVDPGRPGAYDLAVRLDKAAIPEADAVLASADPIDLELDARILRVGAFDRRDWRQTIENWRANGGAVRVERLRLVKGPPRLEAAGDIALDEQRRLAGRLDATFVNAGAVLQRFGLGGGGLAGGLMGALLGGGPPGAGGRETTMRLPLAFENGRVAVGPIRIPGLALRPLY